LFVADHTFTSSLAMLPEAHRRETPAQQMALSLGHGAGGELSGAGTVASTSR